MKKWKIGSTEKIKWNFIDVLSNVKIELSRNNGSSWTTLSASTPNVGYFSWTVTGPETTTALIKISGLSYTDSDGAVTNFSDITDVSDNPFSILIEVAITAQRFFKIY